MSLMLRRGMMLETPQGGRLPAEYQEVEYLQSSGTQYIDTGYTPNPSTLDSFYIKFSDYIAPSSVYDFKPICGCNRIGYLREFYIGYYVDQALYLTICPPTQKRIKICNVATGQTLNNIISLDYVVGDSVDIIIGEEHNIVSFTDVGWYVDGQSMCLFAAKSYVGDVSCSSVKIYSVAINMKSGTDMLFVPCYRKSDSEPGMYDLVNDVFYTNAGTGEFTVGPNVN